MFGLHARIPIVLLGLVMASLSAHPTQASCLSPPGDVTGNGVANVVDVQCEIITVLWVLAEDDSPPPGCLALPLDGADPTCDGDTNVSDAVVVIHHALDLSLSSALDANGDGCVDACEDPGTPNTTLATLDEGVSLTQLPYYGGGGVGGLLLTDDQKLICFADNAIFWRDTSPDVEPHWKQVMDYGDGLGRFEPTGSSSVVVDPNNPSVFYSCVGTADTSDVDYQIRFDTAGIYRSTDALTSMDRIVGGDMSGPPCNGDENNCVDGYADRFIFGCPDDQTLARYLLEPITGQEMYKLFARGTRFAVDPTETISLDSGETVSKSFYFMTYNFGLYRFTYATQLDGTVALERENIHMDPVFYDDGLNTYGGLDISVDFRTHAYEPQAGSTDERNRYPAEVLENGNMACDIVYNGQEVEGDYSEEEGECIEDERHAVGTAVVLDPNNPNVLYAGYVVQGRLHHGGLFRGVRGIDDVFDWTELIPESKTESIYGEAAYPELSLDVRDIIIDPDLTRLLPADAPECISSGAPCQVSRVFYVAAGVDGVIRGTISADGEVALQDISGAITTRGDYIEDYLCENATEDDIATLCTWDEETGEWTPPNAGSSDGCHTKDRCGQILGISLATVEGQKILVVSDIDINGVSMAIDECSPIPTPDCEVSWVHLDATTADLQGLFPFEEGWGYAGSSAAIDATNQRLFVAEGRIVYTVEMGDYLGGTVDNPVWTAQFQGMSTKHVMETLYDPNDPHHKTHSATLDDGYVNLTWDENMQVTDKGYAKLGVKDEPGGYCMKMTYKDEEECSEPVPFGPDEELRFNSYSIRVLAATDPSADAGYVLYVGSNSPGGIDGSIHRSVDGGDTWKMATGDTDCTISKSFKASCVLSCCPGTAHLPKGYLAEIAVDPTDPAHIRTISQIESDGLLHFYESWDYGDTWTELPFQACGPQEDGSVQLASFGNLSVKDLVFDPNDPAVFYVTFGTFGLFRSDPSDTTCGSAFRDVAGGLPTRGSSYPLTVESGCGELEECELTFSKVADVRDLEMADVDGETFLYLAVGGLCTGTWGYFPFKPCTEIGGGGVYRVNASTTDWSAETLWEDVLNPDSRLAAEAVRVSPVDPQTLVVGALFSSYDWTSNGYMLDLLPGVQYSQDGGTTWNSVTDLPLQLQNIAAHPTCPHKFVLSLYNGDWELNLDTSDTSAACGGS